MSARALVIGLDGADVDVIHRIGRERLPALFTLMERGAWARLESVQPPATLPNWTTFLTGVDPGRHGVFDFTVRDGYRVSFRAGTVREAPTIAARLDALGMRCACVGFPGTWPPERLKHGVFVSGWDSPVAFEADASFVEPRSLYREILERHGSMRFDDVDELHADAPGWHDALPAALEERIARKTALASWLLDDRDWDLFAFYFGESDTASHHLWAHFDERSPRHPGGEGEARDGVPRVYAALDRAVAELVARAGSDAEITIVSDHGSGGASDKVLYVNRALAGAGLLAFAPPSPAHLATGPMKDLALRALGPRARQLAFGLASRALPGWLESRARFGAIDMAKTRAFSDELNYFPSVHLNVRGREPLGIVALRELDRCIDEVKAALFALRDPWSGAPVVRRVWRREELFEGPFVHRAPDLLLELHLDDGYSYNLMPTASAPVGHGAWRKLEPAEHLGRKGRSLAGSHRARGLLVMAGPRVRAAGEIHARMADATVTALARIDVAPSVAMGGRVLREAVARTSRAPRPVGRADVDTARPADDSRLEARLRALGYVD
ncbi:MAG: alkaline phosphatase family protein [Sandaracinaceae bacterium]